jgi:hypothetical protein
MLILREGNLVTIGLSRRNIELLLEGNPIRFDGAEAGLPGVTFRIFAGQAEPAPRAACFMIPAGRMA